MELTLKHRGPFPLSCPLDFLAQDRTEYLLRASQSKFFLGSRVIRVGHMVQASPMSTKAWLPAEPSKGEDPLSEDEVAKVTLRL